MTVITFATEPKEKATPSNVDNSGKENGNENGKEDGKESRNETIETGNGTNHDKETGKENGKASSAEDGNGKENKESTGKENGKGQGNGVEERGNDCSVKSETNSEGAKENTEQPGTPRNNQQKTKQSNDPAKENNASAPSQQQQEGDKSAQPGPTDQQGTNGTSQAHNNDATPLDDSTSKKQPVRELSGKALTPREFVPREPVPSNEPAKKLPVVQVAAPPFAAPAVLKLAPVPVPSYAARIRNETGTKLLRAPPQHALAALQIPNEPFTFAKDLAFKDRPITTGPSALAVSLTERSHMTKKLNVSKLQIPGDYHIPGLQLVVFVLIHSSFLPNKLNNIRVPPNATVEHVIDVVVKKLNDIIQKHRPEDPPLIPSKCQLVLAEEDGRPDTDTPVLQRDAAVHRFGCMYFALCKDPESDGVISADSKTFKVILPSKEYQVLSYKRSLSLGQVLEKVCSKRQLDPLSHYFIYSNGNKDVEINLDTLVSDLDIFEVTMKSRMSRKHTVRNPLRPPLRSRSKNDVFAPSNDSHDSMAPPVLNPKLSRHLGLPKEYFWSPATVATYVQYNVIKINKYGKKQDRIMGIDRERITNSMPLTKLNKTSHPARPMSDVVRAYISDRPIPASPSNKKPFSIEFKDNQTQDFESEKAATDSNNVVWQTLPSDTKEEKPSGSSETDTALAGFREVSEQNLLL
eukprot:Phypoly_transcript_02566.p1 GENE.Phypoly_transcript_02566~~Phypoly_transcript_02566.p1  ORF type:complete len:691 (+),score=108.69 Phypoly_transcript_02566:626-2698(+)